MFNKRHYEIIAKTLVKAKAGDKIIYEFVGLFIEDNPRFRPLKFKIFIDNLKELDRKGVEQ